CPSAPMLDSRRSRDTLPPGTLVPTRPTRTTKADRRPGALFDRMSVDVHHPHTDEDPGAQEDPSAPVPFRRPRRRRRSRDGRPPKPRLRKLRLLAILIGLGTLALISTVFGMMMAVAS